MGSIGQSEIACGVLNYAKNRELEFSCFTNNAKLTEIKMIGIAKDNDSSCKKLNKASYATPGNEFEVLSHLGGFGGYYNPSSKADQFYDKCYINNNDADFSTFARNTD